MKLFERARNWWRNQFIEKAAWTDKAIVLLTGAIVFVGVLQTVIFNRQWREMHTGGADTHDLAIAAKAQADEAKVQADQARIQATKATESADYMKHLAEATLQQSKATAKLAAEARKSAEYAGHLAATAASELGTAQANARNDQRAWIGEQQAQLATYEVGKHTTVSVELSNTGKSPARHVTYTSNITVIPVEMAPSFGLDIPDPTWTGIASIAPQGGYQIQIVMPSLLNQEAKDLVDHNDRVIWVWGTLHYEDIFNEGHVTEFCALSFDRTSNHKPASQGMLMYSCPPGNHHDEMN